MSERDSWVEVYRGAVLESRHRLHVAVVDAAGVLRAASGDPERITFFRSAAKPFQALPLVEDGAVERFGITQAELALCCGSHDGTALHVAAASSLLQRVAVSAECLACGPHPPYGAAAARELAESGLAPLRLHNNCSGKHAGMMALARARGWEVEGYQLPGHPVQARILSEISRWSGVPPEALGPGLDGCGVPTYALPLRHMALAYARLAAAARRGERGPAAVVGAMTAHPRMVGGDGRLCTELARVARGRLFPKVGAEGIYCVGVPGAELGIALKVEDGATRALGPAVVRLLRDLDLISEDDFGMLHAFAFTPLTNTRGEPVGEMRARIELDPGRD
jgi:L-asparaginase II